MSEPFSQLGDVVADDNFPAVDLALRRGRHVHKGDEAWYAFLFDAQPLLEAFYLRYGYELVHRSDGYFFLLPVSDGLGKRHLTVAEMIVGQGLALAYLEPRTLEKGGNITREELINQLASAMGTDTLLRALNPKRKRLDERVAQRTARLKVGEALRRLALLGFVELLDADQLRLAPSLLRFAEPVRGLEAPSEALRKLLERGEVSLSPEDADAPDGEQAHADDLGDLADDETDDDDTHDEETDDDEVVRAILAGAADDDATRDEDLASAADRETSSEGQAMAASDGAARSDDDVMTTSEASPYRAAVADDDGESSAYPNGAYVPNGNSIGEELWTDVATLTQTEGA